MKAVTSSKQARALDVRFVERTGLPSLVLMDRASHALAEVVRRDFHEHALRGVIVICGGGNNGGDGYGCARWLSAWGYPVEIWSLEATSSGDAARMRAACEAPSTSRIDGHGLVVDAMFGTGLSRPIEGTYADVVEAIERSGLPVVAADLPSGLCADTGAVLGVAVQATATVTFGTYKPGLFGEPGATYAGRVVLADLGFGGAIEERCAEVVTRHDVAGRWPVRDVAHHKNDSGHVLVMAGSTRMAGAAMLACRGALAAGAGLVSLAAPAGALPRLAALPPEVMLYVSGGGDLLEPLPAEVFGRVSAVVAGPGLGNGAGELPRALADQLRTLWEQSPVPMIFDADALFAAGPTPRSDRVITPHPGEAGRLLACSSAEVQRDRFAAATHLSERGVVLLKGRNTLVAASGHTTRVNPTGNPVLAVGGSGDVLSGVIGSLLGRGISGFEAATLAAWVHGRAADLLAARRSQGWVASDLASALPEAIAEVSER